MKDLKNWTSKPWFYPAVGVLGILVLFLIFKTLFMTDSESQAKSIREAERGFTDTITITVDTTGGQASQPRPDTLPPLIRSEGECKDAMDSARLFFEEVPTGLLVTTQDKADRLNELTANIRSKCDDELVEKFMIQEYGPWSVWQIPEGQTPVLPTENPESQKK